MDINNIKFFDSVYNDVLLKRKEMQNFRICAAKNHKYQGSIYEKECVPEILFKKDINNTYYTTCKDCRNYGKKVKKDGSPDEHGRFKCGKCRSIRTIDFCEKCSLKSLKDVKDKIEIHELVMWERIKELGYCCEQCKHVFVRGQSLNKIRSEIAFISWHLAALHTAHRG